MFDSQDGIKNYDANASDMNYYHPYNLYFVIPSPIKNVNKILLKSVEMPLAWPNIRNVGKMNLVSIGWSIGIYTDMT